MRIGIVGCSKIKLEAPAPARDLYSSRRFKLCFAWAEAFTDRVFIVSSKYGLLRPDTMISPYDYTFARGHGALVSIGRRRAWGRRVATQLHMALDSKDELVFVVGSAYWTLILPYLTPTRRWCAPFSHLGLGSQAAAMQQQLRGIVP